MVVLEGSSVAWESCPGVIGSPWRSSTPYVWKSTTLSPIERAMRSLVSTAEAMTSCITSAICSPSCFRVDKTDRPRYSLRIGIIPNREYPMIGNSHTQDYRTQENEMTEKRGLAMGVLIFASFMDLLDATIVNVALPSIRADLGASGAQLEWVVGGYLLAFAVLMITGGRLGDMSAGGGCSWSASSASPSGRRWPASRRRSASCSQPASSRAPSRR